MGTGCGKLARFSNHESSWKLSKRPPPAVDLSDWAVNSNPDRLDFRAFTPHRQELFMPDAAENSPRPVAASPVNQLCDQKESIHADGGH
jgi:hypothetical protein